MNFTEQDRQTIERVKAGETVAFEELVNKYKDDAFALACSILKDYQLSEDVLQDSFLQVFDKIKTFKFQSSFYTWLYRIVVNRCYNELRRRKNIKMESFDLKSGHDIAIHTGTNDLKKIINFSMNKLKSDEALVLRLFYLSELKIEEVIEITGFSQSKVKVTLHRGRKSLAEILKKHLGKEIEDL